jgi:hypothetical protein
MRPQFLERGIVEDTLGPGVESALPMPYRHSDPRLLITISFLVLPMLLFLVLVPRALIPVSVSGGVATSMSVVFPFEAREVEDFGLEEALRTYAMESARRSGVSVEFSSSASAVELSPETSRNVFRMGRELPTTK